jgi:hypothetical protein
MCRSDPWPDVETERPMPPNLLASASAVRRGRAARTGPGRGGLLCCRTCARTVESAVTLR